MKNIKSLLVICALSVSIFIKGEDKEDIGPYGASLSVEVTKKIVKNVELSFEEEVRVRDNFSDIERFSTSLDMSYKMCDYLKVGGAYNLINLNHIKKGWEIRHRYYFYATGMYKWDRLKFSLRERVQSTFREGVTRTDKRANPKWYMRSRFQVEYNIKKSALEPFASVELFNSLNNPLGNEMDRYRICAGTSYKLSKKSKLEIYYRYTKDKEIDDDAILHMFCVGYSFKF